MIKKYVILLCLLSIALHGAEPKTGFVFDLEGTLIATEWVWFKANDQLLEQHHITIDELAREKLKTMPAGCGLKRSIELLQERFPQLTGNVDDLMRQKADLGFQNIEQNNFEYYSGCEAFLLKLKEDKYPMAIATNCNTKALSILCNKVQLLRHFEKERIYNPATVGGKQKPDPTMYLHAVKQLGLEPHQCIAFEDSPSGAKAAKEAGLYVVGYDSSNIAELAQHTHLIIKEWEALDIKDLIERANNRLSAE
jgi:sugar-phosphatase